MAWQTITVSSKVVGHISAGVYRSPAGAIKELVSNAFDADAMSVVITTNWPSFDTISCRDNGTGITPEKFAIMMSGGIGDSSKRVGDTELTPRFRRPIIGRLGIGMLGIAQLCHEFKVISHHEATMTAFEAVVRLADHLREKVEDADSGGREPIDVGQFDVVTIDYDPKRVGTTVIASDVRKAFVRKFRESITQPLPSKMSAFLHTVHHHRSTAELGDYWKMVWELAIACPLRYVDSGLFDWNNANASDETRQEIIERSETLRAYEFEVRIDGLTLRKPNIYPCPSVRRDGARMSGEVYPVTKNTTVYNRKLSLSGYVYLQNGQAIEPMELRGILIRIRNVAIGGYDAGFLAYPKIEGPRFNWLSGEIFIDEGLEQALNIDRDSFNQMHSHYVSLQRTIHELLPTIFSEASQQVRSRSYAKSASETERFDAQLREFVRSQVESHEDHSKDSDVELPLSLDVTGTRFILNERSPLWPRTKQNRRLVQLIGVAYELSMLAPDEEQRVTFYSVLREILGL